jgi:hypothetical protein
MTAVFRDEDTVRGRIRRASRFFCHSSSARSVRPRIALTCAVGGSRPNHGLTRGHSPTGDRREVSHPWDPGGGQAALAFHAANTPAVLPAALSSWVGTSPSGIRAGSSRAGARG